MADVKKYTDQIAKAQKGRDVRASIVNAINAVSDENNEYNQVKADILAAQADVAKKVTENKQTEQTFAADVKKAEALKQGLDLDITQGTTLKTQLDAAVETADNSKKNLDTSNTTAAKTKADLDASNVTASETQIGLDATNKTATGLIASLGDKITEGTQVKNDIQTTGETAMSNLQAEATKQQEYIKTSIDDTLLISGKAADAAVTGKKINSLKESISNKITKFYASNQGETNLQDSDDGKIMDMMLYGKSEQKQYSGKNLLNPTLQTTTVNGVTCTNNGDGTYTLNGTATNDCAFLVAELQPDNKTYRIIGTPPNGSWETYCITLSNWVDTSENDTNSGATLTLSGDNTYQFVLRVKNGATVNNVLFKPMLTTDLTATYDDFEPYTGGIPSPNPDYPQEIKSVVNPTVKVCGKNLLNVNLAKANFNVKIHNGVVEQIDSDTRADLQWKIIQLKSNDTIIDDNNVSIMQGTRFGCAFTAAENTTEIVFGLNGEKTDTTVRIPVKLKVGQKYVISCNLLNSTQGSIKWDEMMLEEGSTITDFEPYHEHTVTLPYTLNAIPVSSGGNVTIDGQQYIADYVNVERGKLVRMVDDVEAKNYTWILYPDGNNMPRRFAIDDAIRFDMRTNTRIMSFHFKQIEYNARTDLSVWFQRLYVVITDMNEKWKNSEALIQWFSENNVHFYLPLKTPTEIDLTPEEVRTFKALVTYYPTTNISINSEQLDGYTVFNYPISMENGWNYVKQQIGDTRDYIYDMDARTQDTDLQAAEAYVNSEYAVALTELEV